MLSGNGIRKRQREGTKGVTNAGFLREGSLSRKVSLSLSPLLLLFAALLSTSSIRNGESERRDQVEGMFNECGHAVPRNSRATRVVPTFPPSLPPRHSFFLKARRERKEERHDHDVTFVTSVTKGERATLRPARLNYFATVKIIAMHFSRWHIFTFCLTQWHV